MHLRKFLVEEEATTTVEYAVMLMLLAGSIIAALQLVGVGTGGLYSGNKEAIGDALGNSSTSGNP
ncbi:MAG: hypothetical protein AAF456_22345 [Planctomycetota bacterium]